MIHCRNTQSSQSRTQSPLREIFSRKDIFQRHGNCVATTYMSAGFQWSDIQRHVTGIYLTVHRYWILASSQYFECWHFLEIQCFLSFSTLKVNVFICTDVSSCVIQYLLQPTRLIVIRF